MSQPQHVPSPFQGEGQGEGPDHPRNLALVPRAKQLRRNLTDVEKKLWYHLRGRRFLNAKFRRQYPIGNYIVDFICVDAKLIVELDGGQHSVQILYDSTRTDWLESHGYRVLRFWNHEVLHECDAVMAVIMAALGESGASNPLPNPLPERERGKDGL